jgi:hypothetical protein
MEKKLGRFGGVGGFVLLIAGLLVSSSIVYASVVDSFQINEKKIYFTLLTDNDSTNAPEEFALPSVVGRTGHIYIYKYSTSSGGGDEVVVVPASGETIELGSVSSVQLSGSGAIEETVTFLGDETRNTWWVIGKIHFTYQ